MLGKFAAIRYLPEVSCEAAPATTRHLSGPGKALRCATADQEAGGALRHGGRGGGGGAGAQSVKIVHDLAATHLGIGRGRILTNRISVKYCSKAYL